MKATLMKYTIKNATFSALAAIFFAASAFCMEAEKKETESKAIIFGEKSAQAFSFLLTERLDLFNHKMIHNVGRVNKSFDEVCKTIAPRIKHLVESEGESYFILPKISQVWSRYCTAYAYITDKLEPEFRYALNHMILKCDKKVSFLQHALYPESALFMQEFNQPKFNEDGDVYSYYIDVSESEIMEETSFKHCNTILLCALRYVWRESVHNHSLYTFHHFPHLLKAFVNSTFTVEPLGRYFCKLFYLADAIIPENYQESTAYGESFEELPADLKALIIDRYTEQHKKPVDPADLLPVALKEFVMTHQESHQKPQESADGLPEGTTAEKHHKKWYKK